ncbi:MAG: acetyl-coenzyme A synthetase [Flavobacteriales bacterium]|nr:MAG: acetyl-coenzyme A synthetase [Flavobacteriales bacterium]|tara:strand:- start:545 stop:2449 length:1905 start_codon:yes stop_codon:yes gene_type:complete
MSSYQIDTRKKYDDSYKKSVNNPETFWDELASQNFIWNKKWSKVVDWDFKKAKVSWFKDAKLNITTNCIDRHAKNTPDKTAIIFEPNDPCEKNKLFTYSELLKEVCKMANVLKSMGVKKGDRVCIYLPMIPELAFSVLACARIGAIHSVVFAGFSSQALATRIDDCKSSLIITSDGSYRGKKILNLKAIVDDALDICKTQQKVLMIKRTNELVNLVEKRDFFLEDLIANVDDSCEAEIMDAEDPLFILYTSGSTGKPKGMVHTCGGYMVYTSYTFKNIFQYEEDDVYWCTADIGWITGHSYILYGPLSNGASTIMFEGVPSYPDFSRFWQIIDKYKVNQFYTAPTAIRALAKQGIGHFKDCSLKSLKVLGTVGEPINEEAWQWYNLHVGKDSCPIVDTWWQTETGGILISSIPKIIPDKPTFATKPFIGVQPILLDDEGEELNKPNTVGKLCIKYPWPSIARTIWGNHQRYIDTYFSAFKNMYFTGDGAFKDKEGNFRITGRVDDVIIVSGHNLGTAPIEDAINEHESIVESAIVGFPHEIKGNALYGFITLKYNPENINHIKTEINSLISEKIGPIAKLDKIQITSGLPKTRSGKIMRRILRKIASNQTEDLGDISTLLNPDVVQEIIDNYQI